MHHFAAGVGVIALIGLLMLTAILNVESKQRGFRIADCVRKSDELRGLIAFRRDQCRKLLRTDELAAAVDTLGLSERDLFPELPVPDWRSSLTAMGEP